jgi:hypothetical protein
MIGKVAARFDDRRGKAAQMLRLILHHLGSDRINFLDDV